MTITPNIVPAVSKQFLGKQGEDRRRKAAAPSEACLVNPNQAPGRRPNARSGSVQRRYR